MVPTSNPRNMEKLSSIIESDEYDDEMQNEEVWGGFENRNILDEFFNRNKIEGRIIDIGCGSGQSFFVFNIDDGLEPHPQRLERVNKKLEGSKEGRHQVRQGYIENIPWPDATFTTVLSWGTMMFVRSMIEALMEVNRVLTFDGVFIFDVVTFSTMPIAQTVNGSCFPRYCQLFGFDVVEKREFGELYYQRLALALKKVDLFDARRFRLPQFSSKKILNFFEYRDWYLR